MTQGSGSGSCSGTRTYAAAGVYAVTVTVEDDDLGTTLDGRSSCYREGQFRLCVEVSARAKVPSGQTQSRFKMANLKFHSTEYEWLVIAGRRCLQAVPTESKARRPSPDRPPQGGSTCARCSVPSSSRRCRNAGHVHCRSAEWTGRPAGSRAMRPCHQVILAEDVLDEDQFARRFTVDHAIIPRRGRLPTERRSGTRCGTGR